MVVVYHRLHLTFVRALDKSIRTSEVDASLAAAGAEMNAKIEKIQDFVPDTRATEEYGTSLKTLRKEAAEGLIPAIRVDAPGLRIKYLVPEGLEELVKDIRAERAEQGQATSSDT